MTLIITATDPSSGSSESPISTLVGASLIDLAVERTAEDARDGERKGFTPGTNVKVIYKTGVPTSRSFRICNATVGSDGTFSCTGKIRGAACRRGHRLAHREREDSPHAHGDRFDDLHAYFQVLIF